MKSSFLRVESNRKSNCGRLTSTHQRTTLPLKTASRESSIEMGVSMSVRKRMKRKFKNTTNLKDEYVSGK